MASEAAALLDQLMGRSRNAGSGDEVSKEHWSDPDVCKYFLCGFCPSELFTNTRSDIGPCDKIHDEPLQIAYAGSSDFGRIGYEEQFLECLEKVVRDLDKRIQRGKERLSRSAEANKKAFIEESGNMYSEKLHNLSEQITELIDRSEELGSQGNVEEAQELILKVEELERDKERERSAMMFKANVPQTVAGFEIDPGNFHEKNEICDVCGCFLIIGDTQARMDAHLMGKQHMGFARIRSKIVELKQAKEERMTKEREERKSRESRSNRSPPVAREKSPDRIGRRPSYQSGEREKRRSRSRDRNRRRGGGRSRSRERRRSRSRDRRRSRSRERRRSRSRDRKRRSRSGDRRRSHRSRSRDTKRSRRSRSRSHDRNKRRDRRERSKERSRHDNHRSRSRSTDKREKRVSNDEGGDHCEQNGEKEENGTQETIET